MKLSIADQTLREILERWNTTHDITLAELLRNFESKGIDYSLEDQDWGREQYFIGTDDSTEAFQLIISYPVFEEDLEVCIEEDISPYEIEGFTDRKLTFLEITKIK